MVQLNATISGLPASRATTGFDSVQHIESRAITAPKVQFALGQLRYKIEPSTDKDVPDVMIADHAPPRIVNKMAGRALFRIECGAQALKCTAKVEVAGLRKNGPAKHGCSSMT